MPRDPHPVSVPAQAGSVILTKVRIQSRKGLPSVTLDPDFRQDDGAGLGGRLLHV
ncbi:hypothetical protein C8J43_101808 [Sphingomonas sp. PP-CE-1G-424]|nr:hypothetical protein C8J43_101808 [Sphingomonas sp. PP-CE-1G-424]